MNSISLCSPSIDRSKLEEIISDDMNSLGELSIRAVTESAGTFTSIFRQAIRSGHCLEKIDVSNDRFNADDANALVYLLERSPNLVSLNLRYCSFPSQLLLKVIEAITKCSSLRILNLSCIPIDQAIAQKLAECLPKINLSTLLLDYTQMSAEVLSILTHSFSNHPTLKEIYLEGNHLGIKGGDEIAEILFRNNILESLYLYNCNFQIEGGKKIAQALRVNMSLKNLDLHANDLRDEGMREFANALENNSTLETLNLEHNHGSADIVEYFYSLFQGKVGPRINLHSNG